MSTRKVGLSYRKDAEGKYRWHMVAKNGRVIGAASEGFATVAGARDNLELVQNAHHRLLSYYTDANGDHRWRMVARNGLIIGASTEGYSRLGEARKNVHMVQAFDPRPVEIEDIY